MEQPPQPELPANLKFLRRLVTVLTATMIAGLIVIIALLVIRFRQMPPPAPALPALPTAITLPAGAAPQAVTFGEGWVAVVTGSEILIYDARDGRLRQRVAIDG